MSSRTPASSGRRGSFVVIEGGESSGKSTQAALLARSLGALATREPGGTAFGEAARVLLLDPALAPVAPRAELLLAVAARAQHVAHVIAPALEGGTHVVCDRYSGSTLAYQGYGRGLPLDEVAVACRIAEDGVVPDLTVLLDLPGTLASARRSGSPDRIEAAGEAFHERVGDGFRCLAAADPDRWLLVDASGAPEILAGEILAAVLERTGLQLAPVRS